MPSASSSTRRRRTSSGPRGTSSRGPVALKVVVAFDARMATRTTLHHPDHPVVEGDPFFDIAGDAKPVAEALKQHGHSVALLGLDQRSIDQLTVLEPGDADLVFNLCDTLGGDSRLAPAVPTLLEAKNIPFVGADQFGLAVSKRKQDVKAILERAGLPTPKAQVITSLAEAAAYELALEAPVILKLTAEHSSIGIEPASVCFTEKEVKARATNLIKRFNQPVLIEEFVQGREFYVSFFGDPLQALPMMEHGFEQLPEGMLNIRTFDVKWFSDPKKSSKKLKIDPRWSKPVARRLAATPWTGDLDDIPTLCMKAFELAGGRDWGRVDLRLDRGGVPMIIDVTPNTYLGPSAPCVKAASEAGVPYAELVNAIALGAWSRQKR